MEDQADVGFARLGFRFLTLLHHSHDISCVWRSVGEQEGKHTQEMKNKGSKEGGQDKENIRKIKNLHI